MKVRLCPLVSEEMSLPSLPAISVLGDSQAVRLCKVWGRKQPQRPIDICAMGGWTTKDLKRAVRQRAPTMNETCLILISINDILRQHKPHDIKSNLKFTLNILKSHNKSLLISTLPPTLYASRQTLDSIKSVNLFIQSTHNPPSITVLSFHKLFPPFSTENRSLYQRHYYDGRPDNVHLSPAAFLRLINLATAQADAASEIVNNNKPPPPHPHTSATHNDRQRAPDETTAPTS